MAMINYIVVMKQLENGKFLISFPDFDEITMVAETEENVEEVAAEVIRIKLAELKKANKEAPKPKEREEISKTLKAGEHMTPVTVKEIFDFKTTMTSLKDKEAVKETAKEMTNKVNEFVNNVPDGKENLFGIGGGALAIFNTLFLALISIKVPFFGNYSISFFKGLGELASLIKEAKDARFILMFSGILFLAFAGLLIYASFIKNKNILKYSIFGNIVFLIVFYIILYIKLPGGEIGKYISVSYFKILLYLISIGLAYLTYRALNKETKVEETEETIKPLGTILDKEEDKGE